MSGRDEKGRIIRMPPITYETEAIPHVISTDINGHMNQLAEEIWQTAEEHGFHEPVDRSILAYASGKMRTVGIYLSDLSAFEAFRKGRQVDRPDSQAKRNIALRLLLIMTEVFEIFDAVLNDPEHEAEEVADTMIRLLHYAHTRGIDVDSEVRRKMEVNKGRPFKHGKLS